MAARRWDSFAADAEVADVAFDAARDILGRERMHVVVDIARSLSREEVEHAVSGLVSAFPILGCRYARGWWRDRWVQDRETTANDLVRVLDVAVDLDDATDEAVGEQIDPYTSWPWRVTLLRHERGSRLVVGVLHQLADAAGTLVLVKELCARIAGEGRSRDGCTTDRGLWQVARGLPVLDLPRHSVRAAVDLLRLALTVPLLPRIEPSNDAGAAGSARSRRCVTVEIDGHGGLRERCRAFGCTVNDVLIAAIAVMASEQDVTGQVSCFFTVNLRRLLRDDGPRIANLVGVGGVLLPRDSVTSLDETASLVATRMRARKRSLPGLALVTCSASWTGALPHAVTRRVAGLVARMVRSFLSRGSLVTNFGVLDPFLAPLGDAVTGATVIGPHVQGISVPVISATGFGDTLTIQLHGNDLISPDALERMSKRLECLLTFSPTAENG